jgi:hypothetical protein
LELVNYGFKSFTPDGKLKFEYGPYGNEKGIIVTGLNELPGPADLSIIGAIMGDGDLKNAEPREQHFSLEEGTGNVKSISYFGHAPTTKITLEKDNNLEMANFYRLYALEVITIDCEIAHLRLDLSGSQRGRKASLIFGSNARIATIEAVSVTLFEKIVITNGVGVENAKRFLEGVTELNKVELLFSNISEADWRKLLAAIPKNCQVGLLTSISEKERVGNREIQPSEQV